MNSIVSKCTLIISIGILSLPIFVKAQTSASEKFYKKGIEYARQGNFEQAIAMLKRAEADDPNNIDIQYSLGQSFLGTAHGPDSAIVYFEKAEKLIDPQLNSTDFGVELHMALAKSYQRTYQYQKSKDTYRALLAYVPEDAQALRDEIYREMNICDNGIELMQKPVKLEVHNLGAKVNSKYDDHSPVVNADESILMFTSKRISSYSQKTEDGQFSEKIFESTKKDGEWDNTEIIKSILDPNSHESILSLSADGTELYMLRSNIDGQDVFVSNYDGETWSEPYKLPNGINSRFNETHASVNVDKSLLFFTSDRPGGYGGLDIYYARRLPNGEWGVPVNMGNKINTPYDEETPMLHPGGKTLFFSSEGHNSMGGFDIYYSMMLADSSFTEPVNMGYPINTPDDDIFFMPTASSNKAYMSSARFDGNIGGTDIYEVEYEEPPVNKMAVLKGEIDNDANVSMEDLKIEAKDVETGELSGRFKVNPDQNKYLLILEANKKYQLVFSGSGFEDFTTDLTVSSDMTYKKSENVVNVAPIHLKVTPEKIAKIEQESKQVQAATAGSSYSYVAAPGESAFAGLAKEGDKYSVQFITLKKVVDLEAYFKNMDVSKVRVVKCEDGKYRYMFGTYKTFSEAKKGKKEVVDICGYKDAFVRFMYQIENMKRP